MHRIRSKRLQQGITMLMPPVFDAPLGEASSKQATSTSGYADLSNFGWIRVSGADAEAFLQGQLSCDVKALGAGRAQYGSYNTPKGRMLASFLLWRDDTGYFMQLPRVLCAPICKRLSMYVLRSKVRVQDVSGETCAFGVTAEFSETAPHWIFEGLPAIPMSVATTTDMSLLRLDSRCVQIVAPASQAEKLSAMLGNSLPKVDPAIWDLMNIRAGIPYVLPVTQDEFVPQMANLDLIGGVSFSKGCYPGQEIVARMHYLGKLKQRMYLANIAGGSDDLAPQPGDKLYSSDTGEQATGKIMNAAPSPEGGYDVLAVIHIESVHNGDVRLKSPTGPQLQFRALPYDGDLNHR
jgi:folate-binding protein YgfZ